MDTLESAPEEVFLQLPGEERVLQLSRVVSQEDDQLTVAMLDLPECIATGATRLAYFERGGQFLKQPAQIGEIREDGMYLVDLTLLGQPGSAEQRQSYRVSAVGSSVTATLGDDADCPVLDASPTGFAVYASEPLDAGDVRAAVLHTPTGDHHGKVVVQSIRTLPSGVVRYGVSVVDGPGDAGLAKALPRVHAALQREQLRRVK